MSWTRSSTAAIAFVSVWMVIQLVIAATGVFNDPKPDRFVWRMFAQLVPVPEFVVHTPSEEIPVDLEAVTARLRADLPLVSAVPPFLCETVDDAVRVSWADGSLDCLNP